MAVLDYLRGYTSRDTMPVSLPNNYSRFGLTAQYPGDGPLSGFSLTDQAAPPYGAPSPTLMTPEQQAFAQGQVPTGPTMAPPAMPADQGGMDPSALAGLIGAGSQLGTAIGGAAAGGPTAEQDIFMRHFGGGQQQPIQIEDMPPELAQFMQMLFQNGGFQ